MFSFRPFLENPDVIVVNGELKSNKSGGSATEDIFHKMRERYAEIDSKLLPMLPDSQECLSRIKETIPKEIGRASCRERVFVPV